MGGLEMRAGPAGSTGGSGSSNGLFSKLKSAVGIVLVLLLAPVFSRDLVSAAKPPTEKEGVFVQILEKAYAASCGDADLLREYYLEDAEIIHEGRQATLTEMIDELKKSMTSLTRLACGYNPQVKASRIEERFAYLVVRESISLEADEIGRKEIHQICTYVFSKTRAGWKIAHDHCSTVPGMTT
jgi:ketosteroid isomerase-like protein